MSEYAIFKGTSQWSKKAKLYILQFKLNTFIFKINPKSSMAITISPYETYIQ